MRRAERLPFAIEVIAFGDEEGVRFPVTLTGSRTVAGTLDPAALDAEDADRISVRQALQQFGCNPMEIPAVARRKEQVLAYCELHIEQGPVLEAERLPRRRGYRDQRRQPVHRSRSKAWRATRAPCRCTCGGTRLCAAAEMILEIERLARRHRPARRDGRAHRGAAGSDQRHPARPPASRSISAARATRFAPKRSASLNRRSRASPAGARSAWTCDGRTTSRPPHAIPR